MAKRVTSAKTSVRAKNAKTQKAAAKPQAKAKVQAAVGADTLQTLLASARLVRNRAHAPYSKFKVGAAVLDDTGRIFVGCNVENASYGLTVCAERNAVAAAVASGVKVITAVAVATSASPPASPCGACRQVLAEFASASAPVWLVGPTAADPTRQTKMGDLLPDSFRFASPRKAGGSAR